jgi:pyruvate kinase
MNKSEITRLGRVEKQLRTLIGEISKFVAGYEAGASKPHPAFRESRLNLLSYLRLRQHDLKALQLELTDFGLSSLGRCESFVGYSLDQTHRRTLESLETHRNSRSARGKLRSTGTNSLSWAKAEKILHRHTRDLLGPKPKGRHVVIMVTAPSCEEFSDDWFRKLLLAGCNLIRVNAAHEGPVEWKKMISIVRRVSRKEGLPCRILMDLPGPKIRTRLDKTLHLNVGDTLHLGAAAKNSRRLVGCSYTEVLSQVSPGQRVIFDDGKVEGLILERLNAETLKVEITHLSKSDFKLKSEKGINFPDTELQVDEFPPEDLETLGFAARYADLVGLSFVQEPLTLKRVRAALTKLTRRKVGLLLKIETRLGFLNLPKLLIEAMEGYPVGVMIARGDLGVEIGFERMAEVQDEILCLCEAAHIPVVWATQVLESSAKTGMPTRSEVTDAATSVRAECVMLNKGPYILQTLVFLDDILRRMETHTYKRRQIYRPLKVALRFFVSS